LRLQSRTSSLGVTENGQWRDFAGGATADGPPRGSRRDAFKLQADALLAGRRVECGGDLREPRSAAMPQARRFCATTCGRKRAVREDAAP
jgi:hypothetical protein